MIFVNHRRVNVSPCGRRDPQCRRSGLNFTNNSKKAKKLYHFTIKKGIYYIYKKGLAFYVCKEWLVTLVEQMLESLDVFEDAPKYYSKLVEKITVTQIIEDDERIQVRKSNK